VSETKDLGIRILAPIEVTVDREKGIKVMKGVPTRIDSEGTFNSPGTEALFIPNTPYVFKVDELTVKDKEHPNTKISDVNVLMAHGVRQGNTWRFTQGGDVVATVDAYNKYAGERGQKLVEFLVVCNEQEPDPMGIRIGEFDAQQNIAYAVGENVGLTHGDRSKVENGKTIMEVSVNNTFFGLDNLIQQKETEAKIKIL
jgi:hypothetical protein